MAKQLPRVRSNRLHAVTGKNAPYVYLVVYDITHPPSLQKIGKYMERYGYTRWQKSVWIGSRPPVQLAELAAKLKTIFAMPENKESQLAWTRMLTAHLVKTGFLGRSPQQYLEMACGKLNFWYIA
jgi:CRISPR-associated endonuclease Cas2